MGVDKRQPVNYSRHYNARIRTSQCRSFGSYFSSGVFGSWLSSMWYRYLSEVGPRYQRIKQELKKHAADNALTLALITLLFIGTWVWILIAVAFFGGRLH